MVVRSTAHSRVSTSLWNTNNEFLLLVLQPFSNPKSQANRKRSKKKGNQTKHLHTPSDSDSYKIRELVCWSFRASTGTSTWLSLRLWWGSTAGFQIHINHVFLLSRRKCFHAWQGSSNFPEQWLHNIQTWIKN